MKVSVIIPVYNTEQYLRTCLDSVLAQTYEDFEVFVIDDVSTDDSLALAHEYEKKDKRVHVLEQPKRKGAGAARNRALTEASGEYLAFLDSDDYYEPFMLERMVSAAHTHKLDVTICRSYLLDDKTHEREPRITSEGLVDYNQVYSADDLWDVAFRYCIGWPWDKLFRRSFIEDHQLRFQELRTTNDAYFVFMALCFAKRIMLIDDCLVNHRINNAYSLEQTRDRSWENFFLAAKKIAERLRKEGLYAVAERSFLEWVGTMLVWNYETLESYDARRGFISRSRELFIPYIRKRPADYFTDAFIEEWADIVAKNDIELLDYAINRHQTCKDIVTYRVVPLEAQLQAEKARNADLKERLKQEKTYFDEQVRKLEKENHELMCAKHEIEESTSYRLGRGLTILPRALKDRRNRSQAKNESGK